METGLVTKVEGNTVTVKIKQTSACSNCGACKPWGDQELLIEAKNEAEAKVNDQVQLNVSSEDFLQALGILYGIPFAATMLGFVTGYFLGGTLTGFAGGLAMAGLAYIIIKITEPKRRKKGHRAVAVAIINQKPSEP